MNNKAFSKIWIIIALVILLIGGIILFYQFQKSSEEKGVKPPTKEPKQEVPTEANFEECIIASSIKDYCVQKEIEWCAQYLEESEEEKPLPIPVKTNCPDVEIYTVPTGVAGGDMFSEPVLKSDEQYCEFTESNIQKLFAPIQKEEAAEYLQFHLITLAGSAYGRVRTVILTEQDYNQERCAVPDSTEKEVTRVKEETSDSFIVEWIFYTPTHRSGFYKQEIKLNRNGTFEFLQSADEPFIDCGPGIMF